MPSATIYSSPSTPSNPSTLPSPSTFDILPPLHALLSRLLLPPPSTSTPAASSSTPSQAPSDSTYLATKDLPTAVSTTRLRLEKAKKAVADLPDVERTVEEQQEEIEELEAEVARLQGCLRAIAGKR